MPETDDRNTISVIRLGVVGFTTTVGCELKDHKCIGIDIDPEKVRKTSDGACPIYEEGLSAALKAVNLTDTADHRQALDSDITFLWGGATTPKADDGKEMEFNFLENRSGLEPSP